MPRRCREPPDNPPLHWTAAAGRFTVIRMVAGAAAASERLSVMPVRKAFTITRGIVAELLDLDGLSSRQRRQVFALVAAMHLLTFTLAAVAIWLSPALTGTLFDFGVMHLGAGVLLFAVPFLVSEALLGIWNRKLPKMFCASSRVFALTLLPLIVLVFDVLGRPAAQA